MTCTYSPVISMCVPRDKEYMPIRARARLSRANQAGDNCSLRRASVSWCTTAVRGIQRKRIVCRSFLTSGRHACMRTCSFHEFRVYHYVVRYCSGFSRSPVRHDSASPLNRVIDWLLVGFPADSLQRAQDRRQPQAADSG